MHAIRTMPCLRLTLPALLLACLVAGCGSGTTPALPVQLSVSGLPAGEFHVRDDAIVLQGGSLVIVGDDFLDTTFVGVLTFPLAGVGDVQEAFLRIVAQAPLGDPAPLFPLLVDHVVGDGVADTTEAVAPALTAAAFSEPDSASWTLDVTDLVRADLVAGRAFFTLRLRLTTTTNNNGVSDAVRIKATGHADALDRPTLIVTHFAP